MRSVLVTGGAGFIGSNFVRYLLEAEPFVQIINLDALTYAGNRNNIAEIDSPRHHFIHGNICDRRLVQRLFRQYRIDTVVHFAAESHVDRSIGDPAKFVNTNINGTQVLLEAARRFWFRQDGTLRDGVRFHHISTDEVFGSLRPEDDPFTEESAYQPRSPYAASKAASDHLVRAYFHTFKLPVTISNCSNNYGPYQHPEKLVPLMFTNCLMGYRLPIYGDGRQIRDWIYVEDHCDAIHAILLEGRPGETYLVGGGNQPTNLEIVLSVCALMDELQPDSPHVPHAHLIEHVMDRFGHDRRYAVDTSKIESELSWHPLHGLEEGLRATIQWYLEHEEWVREVLDGSNFRAWIRAQYEERKDRPLS